jgi:hypothetical protein
MHEGKKPFPSSDRRDKEDPGERCLKVIFCWVSNPDRLKVTCCDIKREWWMMRVHHALMTTLCWICSSHLVSSYMHRYAKFWLMAHKSLKKAAYEIKRAGVLTHLTFLETIWSLVLNFCDELPCFVKTIWITHLQIPHGARWNVHL